VKSWVDTMVADSLECQNGVTWQLEALSNIFPACFDISPGEDNTITISIDGNQQHIRFKDKSQNKYEKLPPKLFVDYGCRRFDLAGSTTQQAGCRNNFKATSGWNKAEAVAQSKKASDETGLMAATCFHGTNLRFMNVYGGNEWYTHVIRLLESIEADCVDARQIQLCYDVACAFEPSLCHHDTPWVDRVHVSIYRCKSDWISSNH